MLAPQSAVDQLAHAAPPPDVAGEQAAPVQIARDRAHSHRLLAGAILASCALHVAAAATLLVSSTALPDYGVITSPTDAISLESTQTVVLDAIVPEPIEATMAASAAVPAGEVAAVDAEREPLAQIAGATEDPLELVRGAGAPVEDAQVKAQEVEQQEAERHERAEKRRALMQRLRSRRQTAGGPAARASATGTAASGRVSASRGNILSYAARVRAKVARNKPSGIGRKGVAQVSFGIAPSGSLSYARLSRSSGNAALDDAAVSSVLRAAPFDPPPPEVPAEELRFAIPFYFR